ncbi:GNAT family N-acetyltransferase [Geodermatophilus sp. YIM 151500]|uniref:GNAT family N-acetyltransferase n=1 Tax=Geodermatophilus sp. YIM 151500 TaxID=2984531 RepID=UPI0021E47030|nr:GNAT family N-acetyltransferase [Geodermatophilus sp. YIM 151500]MCV2487871.1 GNAT family N-acetyltransferase [Geodermatophilus sp. YIM 151500]
MTVATGASGVDVVPATADRWADVVAVFAGPGDPGRCWCQWFLRGAVADRAHADANRAALRTQLDAGSPGVLGYLDGVPSGWCAVAPRPGYTRLTRSPLLTEDSGLADPAVWSVTCFVVRRPARRQGLSAELLAGAVDLARRGGAAVVEGYPVDPAVRRPASAAELYHGVLPVFLRAGFTEVARPQPARPVVRLAVG